jgi:hypothetical protein
MKKQIIYSKAKEAKSREIGSVISPNTSGLQGQKMQRKKSIKTDIHNQETAGDFERQFYECWENYVPKLSKMTGWKV